MGCPYSGVTESLFEGGQRGDGPRPSSMIFSPSHLLCTIKSQMFGGWGGGGGAMGGPLCE